MFLDYYLRIKNKAKSYGHTRNNAKSKILSILPLSKYIRQVSLYLSNEQKNNKNRPSNLPTII